MSESEVDNQNPSQITRYHINNNVLNMEAVELSRKRKLQTDQFELLPLSKHVCFDESALLSKTYEHHNNSNSSDQCSEIESVRDSNSVTMAEASEYSSSSVNSGPMECIDEIKYEPSSSSLGEAMLHNRLEFVYNAAKLQEYTEKEIVDILYPDEEGNDCNATYVLSSGRWAVNQDSSGTNTRKPTIDQEFEEYFSMLML